MAAFPTKRFCAELLGCCLEPAGRNRWNACSPLPGHDDTRPSFAVYGDDDHAWCFGRWRGGDVIALTGYVFSLERFYDRLERFEHEVGTASRRGMTGLPERLLMPC